MGAHVPCLPELTQIFSLPLSFWLERRDNFDEATETLKSSVKSFDYQFSGLVHPEKWQDQVVGREWDIVAKSEDLYGAIESLQQITIWNF